MLAAFYREAARALQLEERLALALEPSDYTATRDDASAEQLASREVTSVEAPRAQQAPPSPLKPQQAQQAQEKAQQASAARAGAAVAREAAAARKGEAVAAVKKDV